MDVRQDQHREVFMSSLQEDFKDDEDDDEDNRLLISLDDVEFKDDSYDECDDGHVRHQSSSQNVQSISNTLPTYSQHNYDNGEPVSVVGPDTDIPNEVNVLDMSVRHTSAENWAKRNDATSLVNEGNNNDERSFCGRANQSPMQTHLKQGIFHSRTAEEESGWDSLKTKEDNGEEINARFEAGSIGKNGSVIPHIVESSRNALSQGIPLNEKVSKSQTAESFAPHKNCSCIMCYQGRGIVESNWIPTAAKRKVGVPYNGYPLKVRKVLPGESHNNATSLNARTHGSKNLPSFLVNIAPHQSISLDKQTSVHGVSKEQRFISSNSPQVMSTAVLPVLTPKPNLSFHTSSIFVTSSSVSTSSIISNVSSQMHSTMVSSPASTVTSTLQTQVSASATDKARVVVIDKASVEKQLTDLNLNGILQQASKVDMSLPGVVRVFYKPSSAPTHQTPLKDSPRLTTILSQKNQTALRQTFSSHKSQRSEDTILGLVKQHLVNPSAPSISQNMVKSLVSSTQNQTQDTSKVVPVSKRPNILSKHSGPYSLVTRRFHIGNVNSKESSGNLPPPPPLTPCPGSGQGVAQRQTQYKRVEVVNLEEEQTQTIVLPLPKTTLEKSCADTSIDISKQKEMLLSPSLFTFSSPLELSPQKDTPQPSNYVQNQKLPSSSSTSMLSSPAQPIVIVRSSSSISSPAYCPITTISSNTCQKNSLQFSQSPANSKLIASHAAKILNQERSINYNGHLQSYMNVGLNQGKVSYIPHSSSRVEAQIRQDEGMVRSFLQASPSASNHNNTNRSDTDVSSTSHSSVSIVNDTSGLKMKIRLKDSRPEGKTVPSVEELQKNKEPAKDLNKLDKASSSDSLIISASESVSPCQIYSTQICNSLTSQSSGDTVSSASKSSSQNNMERTETPAGRQETAEEMFKRFEDQAMQEVYNAQFGVGQVNRSLRPNRTAFHNPYHLFTHSESIGEPKKKKIDDKSNASEHNRTEAFVSISKSMPKNRRKRSLSGEARHKEVKEKNCKLDINQFPKLMQDNSILNRKTIYTSNIMAGHKVFVKFNTFANPQSHRSFLVPFFNIGGSRTQFDVEDMEYINRAVVDFEKEERSCARHLLFYSREGKKATFVRKERGLYSLDLSPKSYKKTSFILQGYTREKPKRTPKSSEEWKVDSLVAIEIDRAEQECEEELDLPIQHGVLSGDNHNSVAAQNNQTEDQSSSPLSSVKKLLYKISSLASSSSEVKCNHSNSDNVPDRNKIVQEQSNVPDKLLSRREKVNILRRKTNTKRPLVNDILSPSSVDSLAEKSPSSDSNYGYTEQLENIVKSINMDEEGFVSTCLSLNIQSSKLKTPLIHGADSLDTGGIQNIKTEVVDDEYEAALMTEKNLKPSALSEKSHIKTEPVDDYIESLAKSMNTSSQENIPSSISTSMPGPSQNNGDQMLQKSADLPKSDSNIPISLQGKEESSQEEDTTMLHVGPDVNKSPKIMEQLIKTERCGESVSPERNTPMISSHAEEDCQSELDGFEETSLADPDSSPVSDSSTVPSSSELESSNDEEDSTTEEDALFSVSKSSCSGSDLASASLCQNENTKAVAAKNKITSLVETLKQRLVKDVPTFPSLFPETQQLRKRKKKKKKRKRVKRIIRPDSKENSVPSTQDGVVGNIPPLNNVSQMNSHTHNPFNPPINPTAISTAILDKDKDCNSVDDSTVDIKPIIVSTPSLLSVSSVALTSTATMCTSKKSTMSSPHTSSTSLHSPFTYGLKNKLNVGKNLTQKNASSLPGSDDITQNRGISQHDISLNEGNQSSALNIKNITMNTNILPLTSEPKQDRNAVDKEVCRLTEFTDLTKMTQKDGVMLSSSTNSSGFTKSGLCKSLSGGNNISKEVEEETRILNGPESNRSTPCSEIDVGIEETTTMENTLKHNSAPCGSMHTSAPVPSCGRNSIKDFTREFDLMVPLVSTFKSNIENDVNKATMGGWPTSKVGKDRNNSSVKGLIKPSQQKSKEKTSETNVKPSIASFLYEKLSLEVDSTVEPAKKVKSASILTKTKEANNMERSAPSPVVVSSPFYKPTLSAIFGVDNISIPPEISPPKQETELSTPTSQGKQRRQVALKGVCNRKNMRLNRSSTKSKPINKLANRKQLSKNFVPQKLSPQKLSPKKPSPPKQRSNSNLKSNSREKEEMKITTKKIPERKVGAKSGSLQVSIRKQKSNLHSVFRTWRQLSHEEKNKIDKKDMKKVCLPEIKTIPCQVVLHRLCLDDNRNLVSANPSSSTTANTVMSDSEDKKDLPVERESKQEEEQRSVNSKKKRKKSALKTRKRRGPREKKDIVDVYASMLENLRKKAEMLKKEENAKTVQEEESQKKGSESGTAVKVELIVSEDKSISCKENAHSDVLNISEVKQEPTSSEMSHRESECFEHKIIDIDNNIEIEAKPSPPQDNDKTNHESCKDLPKIFINSVSDASESVESNSVMPEKFKQAVTFIDETKEDTVTEDKFVPSNDADNSTQKEMEENEKEKLTSIRAKNHEQSHDVSQCIDEDLGKDINMDQTLNNVENEISGINNIGNVNNPPGQKSGQNINVNQDFVISLEKTANVIEANQLCDDEEKVDTSMNSEKQLSLKHAVISDKDETETDKSASSSHSIAGKECESESDVGLSSPVVTKHIVHPSIDRSNSFLSDTSEPGGLVIDYESEQDTPNEKSTVEVKDDLKSQSSMPVSIDASDLLSDSSFQTKDIVLGFENELGADTVFSSLSQEDLFLLEDGDEDSQIGMISEEEVEKLLGLDVTNETDIGNPVSRELKSESSQYSSSTSLPSNSDKLCWIPVPDGNQESKEKVEMTTLKTDNENPSDDQQRKHDSAKPSRDNSPDMSRSEDHLQVQQKKLQVSPSWNRLLGSEALRQMEKSAPSTTQAYGQQNNHVPSKSQLKVKFCAGALSKALKLSAEMKKVFSDGCVQDASKGQNTETAKSVTAQLESSRTHESKSRDMKKSQQKLSSDISDTQSPNNVSHAVKDALACNEGMQRTTRSKVQTRKKDISDKEVFKEVSEQYKSNANSVVAGETYNGDTTYLVGKINNNGLTDSKSNAAGIGASLPLSVIDPSQTHAGISAKEKTLKPSESEPKIKLLTPFAKGIDLNKLKQKLNPALLSASKKSNSALALKVKDSGNSAYSRDQNIERTAAKFVKTFDMNTSHVPVVYNPGTSHCKEDVTCSSLVENRNSKDPTTAKVCDKQKTDSEPVINTAKLCNLLKNLKKPVGSLMQSKSEAPISSHGQCSDKSSTPKDPYTSLSIKAKTSGKSLRSSPRRSMEQNLPQELKSLDRSLHTVKFRPARQEDAKNIVRITDDEDKGERSFIDCLSDVISGAWDKTDKTS